jgi:hypothetical protein
VVGKITTPTGINVISADLGAGYYNNLNVTVEGIASGRMLFSKTVTVGTQGARLFTFGFTGIDEVDLFDVQTSSTDPYACGSFNCTQFTLDNVTFTPGTTPPPIEPEPASLVLVSVGATVLIFLRKRFRTNYR